MSARHQRPLSRDAHACHMRYFSFYYLWVMNWQATGRGAVKLIARLSI